MNNWIPCAKQLPSNEILVLFYVPISLDDSVCMGYRSSLGYWCDVTYGVTRLDQTDVTHWMPLPDPPPKHELNP